jgi:hypothetical protein
MQKELRYSTLGCHAFSWIRSCDFDDQQYLFHNLYVTIASVAKVAKSSVFANLNPTNWGYLRTHADMFHVGTRFSFSGGILILFRNRDFQMNCQLGR